jgi:hypothetical protein
MLAHPVHSYSHAYARHCLRPRPDSNRYKTALQAATLPFSHKAMMSIVRPNPMTVRTHQITFFDLGQDSFP